ncbi:alpha-amylase family glycosyl hydrolase [Granulicella cerasi]|uniref:Alpha-amylase family glycosyl hydrolase n=1 Tax=Granulicella cerasi TaxID=741063 RepID=A0ABW1ZA02_9BACT|nr:alpha-amylase family glycosyl hydrolase [Granulicella cerasi]
MFRWLSAALVGFAFVGAQAQVKIDKVDPPNWWASMPKPMLLVYGEGLAQAQFTLSDPALRIERVVPSANGHYAQLWLSTSPTHPETVAITASGASGKAEKSYRFDEKKPDSAGFAGFHSNDVMYLIMTDRFADGDLKNDGEHANADVSSADAKAELAKSRGWHGGDLRGVQQHIDYLQKLGVTTVWTTPVYENHGPMSYHGYGATDMYRVDEHYGSLEDLQILVATLHQHHMKYVLDTVPNHVGPANPWLNDPPAPDWFHGTKADHEEAESDFTALINPHASERERRATLQGWFANALPDLNTTSPAVAQYLRQNAIWWVEKTSADGLRIDTYPYVERSFWHDFHATLREIFPHLTTVGETFSADPVFTSSYAGGVTRVGPDTGLDTPFDFPTYFAVREVFLKGKPMGKLNDVLSYDNLFPHPERLPMFIGNHDTSRFREEAPSEAAMRLAQAYVFTTRGMPQLYSGDEIAMRGKDDPDNRRDFPGGFPASTATAFTAKGRNEEQQRMFAFTSELAHLHTSEPALACGAEQILESDDNTLVYFRDTARAANPDACGTAKGAAKMLVVLHRGAAEKRTVPIDSTWMMGCKLGKPLMGNAASYAKIVGAQQDDMELSLAADEVLLIPCE